MNLRFRAEPKLTSQQIVEEMGPGWTTGQVRQRIYRVRQQTKEYLQGIGSAEFGDLDDDRMDRYTLALLASPAARRFWEQQLRPVDRKIIQFCLSTERTPTYQEIAEQLGPGWKVSRVRDRVNRAVEKTRAALPASGDSEAQTAT